MRLLFACLLLVAPWPALSASTFSPDVTDLWWNSAESGWGVNMIQQGNTLFTTFFAYGPDGRPRWYVAPDMRGTSAPSDQPMFFTGPLYETSGPPPAAAFDPNLVTHRQVGNATFMYGRPYGGSISFTIDGVVFSRNIRRQTWALNDINGTYNATRVTRPRTVGCPMPNVVTNESLGTMSVSQSATGAVTIATRRESPTPLSCTYSGTYTQQGHLGDIAGNYSCTDGGSGTFTLSEVEVSIQGFMGKLDAQLNGCHVYGNFGGTSLNPAQQSE